MTDPLKKRVVLDGLKAKQAASGLRVARKAAGYKSASAAAEACGFTNAKYRSHEAGSRPMTLAEATAYAEAFGVDIEAILDNRSSAASYARTEWVSKEWANYESEERARRLTGNRLKIARIARGYDSARQASVKLSLTIPTYLGHEAGKNAISPAFARLYAAVFGVRDSWLLTGELPSGLSAEFDAQMYAETFAPENYFAHRHLVSAYLPPLTEEIAKLKSATRLPEWTSNAGDILREIDFRALRNHRLDALVMNPISFWPLPKGFVRSAFDASVDDILVVTPDRGPGHHRPRDRLFVDLRQTSLKASGQFLVLKKGEPCLIEGGDCPAGEGIVPVGRLVAKFTAPP